MKRTYKVVAGIAAVLTLAVVGAVQAHPGGMGPGMMGPGMGIMGRGMGPMGGMVGANPAAFAESHLATVKAALKITPEQEAAWQTFATKAKQQAETMQALRSKMFETTGPALDRMSQRTETMKQRIGNMETMSAALKDLYAVLTPEQKAVADQQFGMMGGRGMAFARPFR